MASLAEMGRGCKVTSHAYLSLWISPDSPMRTGGHAVVVCTGGHAVVVYTCRATFRRGQAEWLPCRGACTCIHFWHTWLPPPRLEPRAGPCRRPGRGGGAERREWPCRRLSISTICQKSLLSRGGIHPLQLVGHVTCERRCRSCICTLPLPSRDMLPRKGEHPQAEPGEGLTKCRQLRCESSSAEPYCQRESGQLPATSLSVL